MIFSSARFSSGNMSYGTSGAGRLKKLCLPRLENKSKDRYSAYRAVILRKEEIWTHPKQNFAVYGTTDVQISTSIQYYYFSLRVQWDSLHLYIYWIKWRVWEQSKSNTTAMLAHFPRFLRWERWFSRYICILLSTYYWSPFLLASHCLANSFSCPLFGVNFQCQYLDG